MKRFMNRAALLLAGGWTLGFLGCGDIVTTNIATGLREGAVTATTGLIEEFFNQAFGLEESSGDAGHEEQGHDHEGGGDVFVTN